MPAPEEPESPAGPDTVLRALADPHRRAIIRLVRDAELPAGQIATNFELTQQAVSQHLMVLKRAGLLDEFWPDALERLKTTVERDHPRRGAK